MNNIVSGHGGWIVCKLDSDYFLIDNTSYESNVVSIEADVTTSASGGWKQSMLSLKSVEGITVSTPYDSVADVEVQGLGLGDEVTLYCRKGNSSKYDIFTNTNFQSAQTVNDNATGEPIRRTYTFVKGSLSSNQSAPSAVTTFLASLTPPR